MGIFKKKLLQTLQIGKKRRKARVHRHPPPGTPPGTIVIDPESPKPIVRVLQYGPTEIRELECVENLETLKDLPGQLPVTWVRVEGLGDEKVLSKLGEIFGLHQLSLEDVVNVYQRAKDEQYEKYHFIVARILSNAERIETTQLSLFLGSNFVISFQERCEPVVDMICERVRRSRGRIRSMGADYLAYALLDTLIDGYFPLLDTRAERMEQLENTVVTSPDKNLIRDIHAIRRDLLTLRRAIWPQRDAINSLIREETPFISLDTRTYLRDCYDHTIQIIDFLETYREISSGLMEVYLSTVNLRMQEVMKVLTIIATIFLPLSFIASIYGMNFHPDTSPWNMPEITWYWGYPFALGLMLLVAVGFLYFFWRKGWLRSTEGVELGEDPRGD